LTIGKKLVKQQYLLHMSSQYVEAPAQINFYVLFGLKMVTGGNNSHFPVLKNFQIAR